MQLINKDKILNVLSHFKGDALLLYGTRFGAVMLQSITLFIIAAFVNMEEFGRFSFMFSAARVVSVVVGIGGAPFLHRELPYRDEKYEGAGNCRIFIKTLLRPVIIVWFSIPLCLFILLESCIYLAPEIYTEIAFWLNNNQDYKIEVILIIVAGFLFSILDIIIAVLRNAKSATFSMMVNDCLPYLFFLIIFVACRLWIKISSAEMIMLAFIGALLLCCMLALLFSFSYLRARRHLLRDKEKASRQYLTFWGGSILGALLAQSDVLLARYFVDGTTLGFYALLRRISNLISLPQVIVNWSINVEVAKKFASADKFALQESATKGLMIAVPVALLMFIGIGITSSLWLPLFDVELNVTVFGILIILMFAQLVNVMSGANLLFANQCKEEYFVLKSRIFALVLSYIAIPVFAWYWGGLGLAFGCAIPMIILNLMVTYRVRKNIGVWTSVPMLQIGK